MAGTVFLTGATGFVGGSVLEALLARSYAVHALVHRSGVRQANGRIREFRGDLFDAAVLDEGLRGCNAIIHLVGIIEERPARGVTFARIHCEGTRAILKAAQRAGVRRYVHMSALGTRAGAASEYHRTKWAAEQLVRDSGLDWTILRPSMIHGAGGFMRMEVAWAGRRAMPFVGMPYFGAGLLGLGGSGMLQPIYVNDVARAFVDCLGDPRTIGQTIALAGPDRMDWRAFHRITSKALVGKPRLTLPLPAWLARLMAGAGLGPLLGFNRDQVIMSQEDNVADTTEAQRAFGWSPTPFADALGEYRDQLCGRCESA